MKEENDTQEEFVAWINKQERIVTFRDSEGFEKITFVRLVIGSCKEVQRWKYL